MARWRCCPPSGWCRSVPSSSGGKSADGLDMRFMRWVFGNESLAACSLAKLNKKHIEAW